MTVLLAYVIAGAAVLLFVLVFFRLIRIVPEQEAYVVEQLGKYRKTLGPGLHLVVPILQKVAYKQNLKEEAIDVAPQMCITNDNVQVEVDGILYLKVLDAAKASYGIENYRFATAQLAQTTMRSEIGKIELDRSFSAREEINNNVVRSVDEASDPWGIKVTRYEIKDISPTRTVLQAMEEVVTAERQKRAEILKSEGDRAFRINLSKGDKEEAINLSKGEKQRHINEAEGQGRAIELLADATATGVKEIAKAIQQPKGGNAVSFRIVEQFITQFGHILENAETSVLPMNVAQIKAVLQAIIPVNRTKGGKV